MQERIKRLEYWIVGGMGASNSITYRHYKIKIMQLSKHFTLREMTNSMTAQRKGIDNTPGAGEIKSLGDLCYEVLRTSTCTF